MGGRDNGKETRDRPRESDSISLRKPAAAVSAFQKT